MNRISKVIKSIVQKGWAVLLDSKLGECNRYKMVWTNSVLGAAKQILATPGKNANTPRRKCQPILEEPLDKLIQQQSPPPPAPAELPKEASEVSEKTIAEKAEENSVVVSDTNQKLIVSLGKVGITRAYQWAVAGSLYTKKLARQST